jgi:hypothetical protein
VALLRRTLLSLFGAVFLDQVGHCFGKAALLRHSLKHHYRSLLDDVTTCGFCRRVPRLPRCAAPPSCFCTCSSNPSATRSTTCESRFMHLTRTHSVCDVQFSSAESVSLLLLCFLSILLSGFWTPDIYPTRSVSSSNDSLHSFLVSDALPVPTSVEIICVIFAATPALAFFVFLVSFRPCLLQRFERTAKPVLLSFGLQLYENLKEKDFVKRNLEQLRAKYVHYRDCCSVS